MPDLRKSFFKILLESAFINKDIILLTGDLGFSFCEEYQNLLPDQFINCGIAEQNMIGVAAGLALGGKKPFVYSNSIFILMRAYEQVRDEICYNNLPVALCGTGAAGFLGFSHNMVDGEDKQILKLLPNIRQAYPKNEKQLFKVLFNFLNKSNKYPIYVKL